MKLSEQRGSIIPALIKAQQAIGSRVQKDAKNPHFKSEYATLEQVLSKVMDHLAEHGLFLSQEVREASGGVSVATHIVHSSGESIEYDPIYCPAPKLDAQGYGSAITYARRYALMAIFSLAPADDDGNAAVDSTPQTISQQQVSELVDMIEASGTDTAKFCAWLTVDSVENIPANLFDKAKSALRAKMNKEAA